MSFVKIKIFSFAATAFLLSSLMIGCGISTEKTTVNIVELIERLGDSDFIARLDAEETVFISSSDPTGGNDDFNRPLRSGPPGWWVIADLKGPGYVSRFWFTGGTLTHGVRLFFDNEKTPRIDTTISEFCGGMEPFLSPFAAFENYCFYNYVPLTYKQRLIIMVEEGATKPGNWPRIFYQINHTKLPREQTIETFSLPLKPEATEALRRAAAVWNNTASDVSFNEHSEEFQLAPGSFNHMIFSDGPGITREIRITPDFNNLPTAMDRERVLRDVLLRIYWDGMEQPSVLTPLGDFGGSVWRRLRYQNMFFGMHENTFSIKFPMPFAKSMRLELENQGDLPLSLRMELSIEPTPSFDERKGFFHAVWRRSTPADIGRPHIVLETRGRGRFAGCLLSAVSFDKNFWLLEADERMWRDGENLPFWDGTGLEDYFNGGWYYQNVIAQPLHGLPVKNFFRTVQYRIHLPDVIKFERSFRMIFERGPENRSNGTFESLAWYYLAEPDFVGVQIPPHQDRSPPEDPFSEATVMLELFNYERFHDYAGALEFIDSFLSQHENFPYSSLLRLRQAAYIEHIKGHETARPLIEKFLEEPPDSPVYQQADMLLKYHDEPDKALIGLNANMPARVLLNGEVVLTSEAPEKLAIALVELSPGKHVIAVQVRHRPYPDWMQLYLRKTDGSIFTTPEWRHAVNPVGAWWSPDYDDSLWAQVGGTGCKGPPEEPYIFLEPNAFINMQSQAIGLRPSAEWPEGKGSVVYRRTFVKP